MSSKRRVSNQSISEFDKKRQSYLESLRENPDNNFEDSLLQSCSLQISKKQTVKDIKVNAKKIYPELPLAHYLTHVVAEKTDDKLEFLILRVNQQKEDSRFVFDVITSKEFLDTYSKDFENSICSNDKEKEQEHNSCESNKHTHEKKPGCFQGMVKKLNSWLNPQNLNKVTFEKNNSPQLEMKNLLEEPFNDSKKEMKQVFYYGCTLVENK